MKFLRDCFSIHTTEKYDRIFILDVIRGILILLVLYHHATAPLHRYVLQFHMPALFVLSGYTEYVRNKNVALLPYIRSRFCKLIVPYVLFEIANLLLYFGLKFVSGSVNLSLIEAFKSIIICVNNSYMGLYGRLWFLPAMFISSAFAYIIKRVFANKNCFIIIFAVIMLVLSYISSHILSYRLPFTIDISFLGTAFFLLGHVLGKGINKYMTYKNRLCDFLVLTFCVLLFVISNIFADPICHMFSNQYQDFFFMILAAISGTFLTFIAAKLVTPLIERNHFAKDIILWFSMNSLAIFPVHLTIKVLIIPVLSHFGINHWSILLVIMLILTIPIVNIITKYLPFMLGKYTFTRKLKSVN